MNAKAMNSTDATIRQPMDIEELIALAREVRAEFAKIHNAMADILEAEPLAQAA